MRIALIQAPHWQKKFPPLAPASLSAVLRKAGHETKIFDLNSGLYHAVAGRCNGEWNPESAVSWMEQEFVSELFEKYRKEIEGAINEILAFSPDAAGFSVQFSSMLMSSELAKRIKERKKGTYIIFGGPECFHGRAGYELIEKEHIDALVMGEGEASLLDLLKTLEEGKRERIPGTVLKKGGRTLEGGPRPEIEKLDSLPFPDFTGLDFTAYESPETLPVSTSRGCPSRCVFCNVGFYWKRFRRKTAGYLIRELKYQLKRHTGIRSLYFADSIINGDPEELGKFCDLMIAEKKKDPRFRRLSWGGEAFVSDEMTGTLLRKMFRAGCRFLSYGLESGSERILKSMGKNFTPETAERVLKDTHNLGIYTTSGFIVGFPGETEEDFRATLRFLKRVFPYLNAATPSETCCSIDPGTFLSRRPELFGISPGPHMIYWQTRDGRNTYPLRLDRFRRFCDYASFLGIHTGTSGAMGQAYRWLNLAKYFEHKKDKKRAVLYKKKFERSLARGRHSA
ncbi:MAG TPA: radical SAM protein [bacterium]|nr:radical SAM protein [bacterium]